MKTIILLLFLFLDIFAMRAIVGHPEDSVEPTMFRGISFIGAFCLGVTILTKLWNHVRQK